MCLCNSNLRFTQNTEYFMLVFNKIYISYIIIFIIVELHAYNNDIAVVGGINKDKAINI